MSATAIYDKIDPNLPGAFSSKMVDGLLRKQLGFDGLVITDDLSNAVQVQSWTPGQRAVLALSAGNDLVLENEPTQIPEMISEVLQKAKADPDFAKKISQSAPLVVQHHAATFGQGVLHCLRVAGKVQGKFQKYDRTHHGE